MPAKEQDVEPVSDPAIVLKEVRLTMPKAWWKPPRAPLYLQPLGSWLPLTALFAILGGIAIRALVPWHGYRGPLDFITGLVVAAVALPATVVAFRKGILRSRQALGDEAVEFLEVTANSVATGVRGKRETRDTWVACDLTFNKGVLKLVINGAVSRLNVNYFTSQEIATLVRWADRSHGRPDHRPQCHGKAGEGSAAISSTCGAAIGTTFPTVTPPNAPVTENGSLAIRESVNAHDANSAGVSPTASPGETEPWRIVKEVRIPLPKLFWREPKSPLFRRRGRAKRRYVVLIVVSALAFGGAWFSGLFATISRTTVLVFALIFVFFGSLQGVSVVLLRRQNWKNLRSVADEVIEFIEATSEGLETGIRGLRSRRTAWTNCDLELHNGQWVVAIGNAAFPLDNSVFTNQEFAQILYWTDHAHGRPDLCPKCRYDLRASTGPMCPECGGPIRRAIPSPQALEVADAGRATLG